MDSSLPRRFRTLTVEYHANRQVFVAKTFRSRLLGLAWLKSRDVDQHRGLLLTKTSSIHTFGMLFPIDLIWLDSNGRVLRVDHLIKPWRLRACRGATAVLELPRLP